MENIFLSQLLPYDLGKVQHGELRTGLNGYQMLLNAFLKAIHAIKNGDLTKFDSLVGENACQIRAVWIILIATKFLDSLETLEDKIKKRKNAIDNLLALETTPKLMQLMKSQISLGDLLKNEMLDVSLTQDEMFIIQAYILSEAKVNLWHDKFIPSLYQAQKIVPKNLKKFGNISAHFADKLISKLRKLLSIASTKFIKEKAFIIGDTSIMNMTSDKFTINHNNWLSCAPMFWTYKTILYLFQIEKIPIVIHAKFLEGTIDGYKVIDSEYLFFDNFNSAKYSYVEKINSAMLNRYVCVIQGAVCVSKSYPSDARRVFSKAQWQLTMKSYSITDVILAGAAHHRQYPDPSLDQLIIALGDQEYENYKMMAEKEGFSDTNPTTFFIQHVYAARVDKIPEFIEEEFLMTEGVYITG